ncbi:MAG: cyanophycin synthetase, partial [Myxococcota bacterium]|nr:cyanophycin synthetase [Myxococcota bacterium]
DDRWSRHYAESARGAGLPVLWFGRGSQSPTAAGSDLDLRSVEEQVGLDASRFVVESKGRRYELSLPLPGDFQIDNALAAVATALALGIPWNLISDGLAATPPIPGRLEAVSREPAVLVDYAHTPDALDRVLSRVRPLVRGRLITVFGCGGNRDRSKRAPMAAAACRHSDYVIATSDNPRTERAEKILDDLREGLDGDHEVIVDRREAIRRAIAIATAQDTVVIAGKGHENYQILGQDRVPFDDREEARKGLALRYGEREQTP